jgi:polyhydroxyalkanoate synthesis regulator phasin
MARASSKSRSRPSPGRADKSVDAFRDALERSVTISRDRLQEIVDDSVKRGRMTRRDANDLVSKVVDRGKRYHSDLLRDLERLLEQPLRRADEFRRRAGVGPTFPITAYDRLTAIQVKARLSKLTPADLRKVRTYEQRNKARKGVLSEIDRRLR